MGGGDGVVIGMVYTGSDAELAEDVREALPDELRERVADQDWRIEQCEVEPAEVSVSEDELIENARRRSLDQDWDLAIGLTSLPLRDGRRPVAAYASASHGVAIISVPALGVRRRHGRLRDLAVEMVQKLLGGEEGMEDGSGQLASSVEAADSGTLRFTGAVGRSNLGLLVGMIRANQPARVVSRLSRSSAAALGTGAYALTSSNIWMVAHDSSWVRLLAVGLVSLGLILFAMLMAHGLWERAREPAARERIVMFNIVTVVTLAISIATLYLALYVILLASAAVVLPPSSIEQNVSGASGDVGEYLRLAWLATSVATVGGALGSMIESHEAVREAMYRRAPEE